MNTVSENIGSTVAVNFDVPAQMIDDILCTAFEGGITYWATSARVNTAVFPDGADYVSECLSRGSNIIITDDGGIGHTLTLNAFVSSVQFHCNQMMVSPGELHDDHDAVDADSIVQYALFGDIIYG